MDSAGNPIVDAIMTVGSMIFQPGYDENSATLVKGTDDETGEETGTGTVTVTNTKVESYKLPATGGEGTALYVAGGLMIIGMGLLFAAKQRPKRQR